MAKIIGGVTATNMPVSDWNQTDPKKADYIKNKPPLFKPYADWQEVEDDIKECGQSDLYVLWVGEKEVVAYNWPINLSISLIPGAAYHITAKNHQISTCDCLGAPVKVDQYLDAVSQNPIANSAVYSAFTGLRDRVATLEGDTPAPSFKPYKTQAEIHTDAALIGDGFLYVLWVGSEQLFDYDSTTMCFLAPGALLKCTITEGTVKNALILGNTQPGVGELKKQIGDVEAALDAILAMQEALIGGAV